MACSPLGSWVILHPEEPTRGTCFRLYKEQQSLKGFSGLLAGTTCQFSLGTGTPNIKEELTYVDSCCTFLGGPGGRSDLVFLRPGREEEHKKVLAKLSRWTGVKPWASRLLNLLSSSFFLFNTGSHQPCPSFLLPGRVSRLRFMGSLQCCLDDISITQMLSGCHLGKSLFNPVALTQQSAAVPKSVSSHQYFHLLEVYP